MGKMQSGVWFILVTLYFILFIATVSSIQSFTSEQNVSFSDGTTVSGNFSDLTLQESYVCDSPRYQISADGSSLYKISSQSTSCLLTEGVINSALCEQIVGCSWENVTTGFWFFTENTETCMGTINTTYYGVQDDNNLCRADLVRTNITNCERLGCFIYYTEPLSYDITSPRQLLNLVSDLFTFRYDFGFEGLLNALLTIILLFIPLFIWLMSLYFMLPFVH